MTEWNAETAEWYAEKFGDYPTNRLAVAELELQPDDTILDIGCGTGTALRFAAEKVLDGSLIGIDPVPRMVEIAKEQTKGHPAADRITFQEGSAEDIPLENNLADFVFAFDSVDHWTDLKRGLSEVLRVLKPNGTFVVVKDLDVPAAKKRIAELKTKLESSCFSIFDQRVMNKEGIKFVLIICTGRKI